MTVGEGTESVFEQFCQEEEFIRMAFKRTFGTERPELHQLVEYFFGPDSKIFQVLKDNISIHRMLKCTMLLLLATPSGFVLAAVLSAKGDAKSLSLSLGDQIGFSFFSIFFAAPACFGGATTGLTALIILVLGAFFVRRLVPP